ncbi:Outer membrane efflux protein BepC [Nymphon striatum]|nr:Outer membrane efflux protein BepC [Nymphon striatum]
MRIDRMPFGMRLLAGVCALGLTVLAPRAVTAETLADALVGAYTHSGLLDQNRALLRAADEDVASAVSTLKPVLRWSTSLTQTFGRVRASSSPVTINNDDLTAAISLVGELVLYDFGSRQLRVEAAKESVLATREALVDIEQQVLFRAVRAYMGVIEATEFVALRQNNVRLLTQELRAAQDRFEVGEVTRTDVALAQAQLAQARSGLAQADGNLLSATEEYRNVIGRKPGRLQQPPSLPRVEASVEKAKAIAVRRHPSLLGAQHQVACRGFVGACHRSRYEAAGQIIYQGGALSSTTRQAKARADAQRGNLHVVRHNVQQTVGDSYAQLTTVKAQLAASERQVRAASIAFRGIREEATLGARTTLDVLDAEQALLDAQSLQVSAGISVYVAAYGILVSTGHLTAKQLRLPVQIYDPAAYYNLVKDSPAKRSKEGQKLDRVLRALQKD